MKVAKVEKSLYFTLTAADSVSFSCPFWVSRGRWSSVLPFACSGRNRPSVMFILSVNGPHIAGHGEAICPRCDGCISRFLQLHFWQTDIWAHLKPGGITFSQVCDVGIWPSCKPRWPYTCLPQAHTVTIHISTYFVHKLTTNNYCNTVHQTSYSGKNTSNCH